MVMLDLVAPMRREARFLLSYGRSRPRFTLHLAIDAILSIALAVAVFHIATSSSHLGSLDTLKLSGAVAMSGGELENFIKHENLSAYWAGSASDDKYTLIATTPGEVTITYFPKSADITHINASVLAVQTHQHFSTDAVEAYAQDVTAPGAFLLNQGDGNAIHYEPATPTRVTITFRNRFEAVTVFNPTPQASLTLAMKPGAIQKVS